MVRRKIQCLEVIVVRLNHRPLGNRITQLLEDGDNLVHSLDDWMLNADGMTDTGEGDVDAVRYGFYRLSDSKLRSFDEYLDAEFQFIDVDSDFALFALGRSFQPQIVDLRQDPGLPSQPAVTKQLQLGFVLDSRGLCLTRIDALVDSLHKRCRRVIR